MIQALPKVAQKGGTTHSYVFLITFEVLHVSITLSICACAL